MLAYANSFILRFSKQEASDKYKKTDTRKRVYCAIKRRRGMIRM